MLSRENLRLSVQDNLSIVLDSNQGDGDCSGAYSVVGEKIDGTSGRPEDKVGPTTSCKISARKLKTTELQDSGGALVVIGGDRAEEAEEGGYIRTAVVYELTKVTGAMTFLLGAQANKVDRHQPPQESGRCTTQTIQPLCGSVQPPQEEEAPREFIEGVRFHSNGTGCGIKFIDPERANIMDAGTGGEAGMVRREEYNQWHVNDTKCPGWKGRLLRDGDRCSVDMVYGEMYDVWCT
jgi:hypothetical protein